MTRRKSMLLVAPLAALLLLVSSLAVGQNNSDLANGFRITPVLQEFVIEPGDSESTSIKATNPTDGVVRAKVVVNDFEPSLDETGQPSLILDEARPANGNSFKSLVGDLGEVELGPKEEITIPYDITVPDNASPGGYYGAVRLEALPGDSGQVNVTASVGTLHLITVPGDITEAMELVEISAARGESTGRFFIGDGDDFQVVTRLLNTGNIHLKPNGRINITDSSGNEVVSYEFNQERGGGNVLPDSTRKFVDEIEYDEFFGKYTITAYLGYGSGGNLITATNTFWVIPLWLVIVAAVALVAILVIAFLVFKKLQKTRKHKVKPRR